MTPAMAAAFVRHNRVDTTNRFVDGHLLCVEWKTCLYCQQAIFCARDKTQMPIRQNYDANGSEVITCDT